MKEEFKDHSHICKIVYKNSSVVGIWENIKEVETDTDFIKITTHTGKISLVQLDNIQRLTIAPYVGKNSIGDFGIGYDTALDEMKEWCKKKLEKMSSENTTWCYGYRSSLIDVIEKIERW